MAQAKGTRSEIYRSDTSHRCAMARKGVLCLPNNAARRHLGCVVMAAWKPPLQGYLKRKSPVMKFPRTSLATFIVDYRNRALCGVVCYTMISFACISFSALPARQTDQTE